MDRDPTPGPEVLDLLDHPHADRRGPEPLPAAPAWHVRPRADASLVHVLWVLPGLAAGGEATEARLLAQNLPRDRVRVDVVPCRRLGPVSDRAGERLRAAGVAVDTTSYGLSFEDTVRFLARKAPGYDVVISSGDVADIHPALEQLAHRPPLVARGAPSSEARSGPRHLSARGAAAMEPPRRPHRAVEIPPMVDLSEFVPGRRDATRRALGVGPGELLVGWVGSIGRRHGVEDALDAFALVAGRHPEARFVVVGTADDPGREPEPRAQAPVLAGRLRVLGSRADLPDLLVAMDAFLWLAPGGPHVLAEAGAASLPVVAIPDEDASAVRDGETGLIVPSGDPAAAAAALSRLLGDPALRQRLGGALRAQVERRHAAAVVVPQWQRLLAEVVADRPRSPAPSLFRSFVLGGWECSTHVRRDGRRIDVLAATGHDRRARQDYAQLGRLGIRVMRDGLRWHLIDGGGAYDWSSWTPMLDAARDTGTEVVWDLLHYGLPDGLDVWTPAFLDRFRRFARAAALHRRERSSEVPWWCPVNEMSFLSWGGGDVAYLNPFARGRGFELKCQLARASILAMEECLLVDPRARFLHAEPLIAIHHDPATGRPAAEAQGHHEAQFQAFDLVAGRMWPGLGGREALLDVVGVNYYFNNQWVHGAKPIDWDHPLYAPLSDLLLAVHARYGRPVVLAETGVEGDRRAPWAAYVGAEVARARRLGARVEGVCLYPVANHPGWDDDRDCPNGLLEAHGGPRGERGVHAPLAAALPLLDPALAPGSTRRSA